MNGKTHWKEFYIDKYAGMDLIDRKKLLKFWGCESQEDINKAWDEGTMDEDERDLLQCIMSAEGVTALDIVNYYDEKIENERKMNP